MRTTIGNMDAIVAPDGRSVELAPPGGERPAIHLNAFETSAAPQAKASVLPQFTFPRLPPDGSTDLLMGLGAALLLSALAVGFVLRRSFVVSEPTAIQPPKRREGRLYDNAAERDAFMKRYGGAS